MEDKECSIDKFGQGGNNVLDQGRLWEKRVE